ncbi:MAG: hypothetical protein WKG06_31240 [Segetibacter sp.]
MERASFENKSFKMGEPIFIILKSGKSAMGYFMGEYNADKGTFIFRNKDQDDRHELPIEKLAVARKGWY